LTDPQQGGRAPTAPPQSFAALRHPGYRAYFAGSALAMMADSIEHVISYWIIFQKFHSPALGGFAMLSHWLPFLFFSVLSGALADRFDPRRLIQIGMALFMIASLGWGVLFLTGKLEMWHAAALLVIHGFAGVFWHPSAQLLITTSSERPISERGAPVRHARYLGLLFGPAVGGVFLLAFGPAYGLLLNALIYLRSYCGCGRRPTGRASGKARPGRCGRSRGSATSSPPSATSPESRTIVSMILLAGVTSFFVGNGYQPQMPEFAHDLGHGDPDLSYSMLLAADAAGALFAGFILESRGLLQAKPRTALLLAMLWCCAIGGFAASTSYALALAILFVVGFLELSFNAMAQTLVQLHAPAPIRGRVIGLYILSGLGMRAFSGVTVGIIGGLIGIHWSLALSAMALLAVIIGLFAFTLRRARPT